MMGVTTGRTDVVDHAAALECFYFVCFPNGNDTFREETSRRFRGKYRTGVDRKGRAGRDERRPSLARPQMEDVQR